jgi:hypothetical protein
MKVEGALFGKRKGPARGQESTRVGKAGVNRSKYVI